MMHDFYSKHCNPPKKYGTREHEQFLATWTHNQRAKKNKGLNPELCERIEREFPWWSWDPLVDALERNITQMHAFYAAHGEPKKGGVRENEASLANWVGKLRGDKKKGLTPELSARIDREFYWWSWDLLSESLDETVQNLTKFYTVYGEPRRDGVRTSDEHFLSRWIGCRRQDKKNGRNIDLCDWLQKEFSWWTWDPIADEQETKIKQMHLFYAKYGLPKQHGIRANETSCASWMTKRRQDKKHGRNPELCARVEREFKWWNWNPRDTMTVTNLKHLLRERGLNVGGTKTTLIARLRQNDASLVLHEEEAEQADSSGSGELPAYEQPDEEANDTSASGKPEFYSIYLFEY